MKPPWLILSIAIASLFLAGCEARNPAAKPVSQCQRFVPISPHNPSMTGVPWHGYFALDTKTGQLCHTAIDGPQGGPALPNCFDLYKSYPDSN